MPLNDNTFCTLGTMGNVSEKTVFAQIIQVKCGFRFSLKNSVEFPRGPETLRAQS